jgi:crotonobetainyl-CoA:carnitine CoA-transferase CaiB-like acyl-CoA transferase
VPGPAGQHHPLSSPYGRFRARDGYLNIAAPSDTLWRRFACALGREDWISDPRFAGQLDRLRKRAELTAAVEEVLLAEDVAKWVDVLNEAGVPCGPVFDMAQVFADPQVAAREMHVELPHPEVGTFQTTGLPVKLSRTPGAIERRPPLHGEHTDEVLRECGVSDDEIAALRQTDAL